MPSTLGSKTENYFLKGPDGHNIFMEFEAGSGGVHISQPVVLSSGKIVAAAGTNTDKEIIGYSLMERAEGAVGTIVTKFRTVVQAEAAGALSVGDKLKLASTAYNTTTKRVVYDKLTSGTGADDESLQMGTCLSDATAQGDEIFVGLF